MSVLIIFLLVVEVIVSLLLIGVVLLQKSKGEGFGMALGAGVGESLFGSRAGNVLTRATIMLSSIFLINTLALAILYAGRSGTPQTDASLVDQRDPGDAEPAVGPGPESGAVPVPGPVELPAPVRPAHAPSTGDAADHDIPPTE